MKKNSFFIEGIVIYSLLILITIFITMLFIGILQNKI